MNASLERRVTKGSDRKRGARTGQTSIGHTELPIIEVLTMVEVIERFMSAVVGKRGGDAAPNTRCNYLKIIKVSYTSIFSSSNKSNNVQD